MKLPNIIPVIFHNLKGYDSHLLMQELGKFDKGINVIPSNMEKYMSFLVGNEVSYHNKQTDKDKDKVFTREIFNLKFIDSYQFMPSSLAQLVTDLKRSSKDKLADKFKYTSEEFGEDTQLMTRKGIYPYSYMDCWDKFDVTPETLTKIDFRNDLTGDDITDEDFEFYSEVCNKFNIKSLGEHHDLYLKSDVLLLADVFENFRKTCFEYYHLDPCHYISSPGLAWAAMLKMTDVELELISDIDMYLFIEKGL